ncbi:MAG: TA system VapC family ribonuclease toxin [Candidatus Sulfotelmatobacter sp.]
MILLDANILLYAYDAAASQHIKARAWVETVFSDVEPVGLPWQSLSAFLRIMTDLRLPGKRFTVVEAAEFVNQWLEQPNVRVLTPGDEHWLIFRKMIVDGQASGPLVSDAHLAALTLEYGGVLYTTDRDFARFPGLRWTNPLI